MDAGPSWARRGMVSSDARQQTGRPQDVGRPAFDLVAAKLLRPLMRHGTVRRSPLIEQLARTDSRPIVSALYLREGGTLGQAAASFGGDDRFVSEYVQSE